MYEKNGDQNVGIQWIVAPITEEPGQKSRYIIYSNIISDELPLLSIKYIVLQIFQKIYISDSSCKKNCLWDCKYQCGSFSF